MKPTNNVKFDETDYTILNILQENCRANRDKIAKQLHTTPQTIIRRINKLENEDVIRGYHTILNSDKLQNEVLSFILIQVPQTKMANGVYPVDFVGSVLKKFDEVEGIYELEGEHDLMVKVRGESIQEITNWRKKAFEKISIEGLRIVTIYVGKVQKDTSIKCLWKSKTTKTGMKKH